jgi:glycerophosphoryl diester phosphodiesterase
MGGRRESFFKTIGIIAVVLQPERVPQKGIIVKPPTAPWIIAHRGARNEAPENTMTALQQALTYPVDGVEFDVQMSSDGVPLLYHDETLLKVGGGPGQVCRQTAADLERIDWGGWYDHRFRGEPMPRLEQALTLLGGCPKMCIEIKSTPAGQATGHTARLTEKVIEQINHPRSKPFKNRILLLSFDPNVLIQAHQMDTDLRYVLNLPEKSPMDRPRETDHLWAVDVRIGNLSAELAQWSRRKGLRLFTYTCNSPRQIIKAMHLGVDAIITDRPKWATDHLGRH